MTMKFAAFAYLSDAQAHRQRHGGWIFIPTGGEHSGDVYWFSTEHTVSIIFTHALTRGMDGELV